MKLKRFRNKFISMLLTLAMLLTLFPTAVFAEDTAADRPASAEFKIMGLYALRDNGRRVSFFSYESRDNAFLTKANMTYPDSWFKLIYVIERSQPVTLELYEMKDEPAYSPFYKRGSALRNRDFPCAPYPQTVYHSCKASGTTRSC